MLIPYSILKFTLILGTLTGVEQLGPSSLSTPSAMANMCGPFGLSLREFPNLLCSQKQPVSIELTLSVRRICYCLLTVKSLCLLNKHFSIYSDMFIKTKAISIKTKATGRG